MVLKKVNNLEKSLVEIEFSIDKETFSDACNKAYKKNIGKMKVPGFRQGKAPKAIIEKMYGKGVFYEEALNNIIPVAFEEAINEASLTPVSRPEYDVEKIDDDGVDIKAKFYVYPAVEIKDYKGIKAERILKEVTDEEVDAEIKRTQERNSRMIDITDRPAQDGDTTVIDFDGYVDGTAFEGGKGEKHTLKLGSGHFIPGFEEQIVGHSIGDSFDVNVTFPEDYHANELAGKEAVFKTVLHEIKYNELPELDDEFAKDVSEFDTFAEYKADVRAKLEEKSAKAADAGVEEKLIETLINNLEGDIPEAMFEAEAENMVRDYDTRLRMQGLDLNTYFKYTGQSLDSMREQFKPQAERQVKTRLALEKIAELENITANDDEIEEEYQNIAKAYGMEADKVKGMVDSKSIAKDIAVKKAVDLVKGAAEVTDTKEEKSAEEKPKATAKKAEDGKTTPKKTSTTKKASTAKKTTASKTEKEDKTETEEKE